jgi:predicted HicB family RNase H-like nuclease
MKTKKLQVNDVPTELFRTAKLQAISEDKSLRLWIIEAVKEKLKRSDPSRRQPQMT